MSVPMEVVLLERVDNLGKMGEVVRVKPGYARNFLLPQKKALRATKDNMAYFEAQRAVLEKANAERRKEAEKLSKKVEGKKVVIIRHASEAGQMFGSVSSRDVAEAVAAESGVEVTRNQVHIHQPFKMIGLFPVTVALHPEVHVTVTVNIARSEEEANIQAKTGKALIADQQGGPQAKAKTAPSEDMAKEQFLDSEALENERQEAEEEVEAAADAEKPTRKSKAKAKKAEADDEEE